MRFGPICTARQAGRSRIIACLLAVLVTGSVRGNESGKPGEVIPAKSMMAEESSIHLSGAGEVALHAIVESGELSDLRWPGFQNYRVEMSEFYASFPENLPWAHNSEPSPQALQIIQALKHAETKGLRPEDYDGPRWDERIQKLRQAGLEQESDLIRFDVALTVCTMRYISDLHNGRINPRLFHFDLDIGRHKFDLSEFLASKLVDAQDMRAALASVEPPFPAYRRTIAALNRYLELARQDDGQLLPVPPKVVKPGDPYAGTDGLAKRLRLLGDFPVNEESSFHGSIYQGNLVSAVKHFQERHGLDASGRIDTPTFKQLNTSLSRRVVQLELTLDRWRWLPHQFEKPPIVVNIPEFRLYAADEVYKAALTKKVVIGKAYQHKTPVFASEIKTVIFRPYWNVPFSIQKAEIVPKIKRDPSFLVANSYEIADRSGKVVSDGAVTAEIMESLQSGKLYVRQKPGPDNSLGLVKFEFPNPYDVFMHGTPAEQLFLRPRRDFSHGCIRVEDPAILAAWILSDMPEWTLEKIRDAMNGDQTIRVAITTPIPILILYGTAVVRENGEVQFFNDIYKYDADLERALSKDYPNLK